MRNVLVVGENPYGTTGNAKMARYILQTIDTTKYRVHVFSIDLAEHDPIRVLRRPFPLPIVSSFSARNGNMEEPWGKRKLIEILDKFPLEVVIFVGLDIWRYADVSPEIQKLQMRRGFQWIFLFPYDLQNIRDDYVKWINQVDTPCVYSDYGYKKIKHLVPRLEYFRPSIAEPNQFIPYNAQKKKIALKRHFPMIGQNTFLFGYIGANQSRKEPLKLIKATAMLQKDKDIVAKRMDIRLCMFTNMMEVYNLIQYAEDQGMNNRSLLGKPMDAWHDDTDVSELYNCFDCYVNCSMQEGLSWTVIEAMMCGVPVIASHSTAHIELLDGTKNIGVRCETPASLYVQTASGPGWIDTKCCDVEEIVAAMKRVAMSDVLKQKMATSGFHKINQWDQGKSDINTFIRERKPIEVSSEPKIEIEQKILFAQHSSAGDILMTTRCLKGLRDRHKGLPLVYMTQKKYWDLVSENPYIDEIVDWDEKAINNYAFRYAPHRDRILPAGWGRNSNSILSDFYWKILKVDPTEFVITPQQPKCLNYEAGVMQYLEDGKVVRELTKPICIVHTTGGDASFRQYRYMNSVCAALEDRYSLIQIGGAEDFPAYADLDLSGEMTYRENAWIMQHAKLAITVDSFVSHLAGAFGVSQVCLFGSGNAMVCRPAQLKGSLICRSPNYVRVCKVLGPCSAAVRDCPIRCTAWHKPEDIIKDVIDIENATTDFIDFRTGE